MFHVARLVVISFAPLVAWTHSTAAQSTGPSLQLQNVLPERIDEIREAPDGVTVRGSLVGSDGRTPTSLVFVCRRLDAGQAVFVIQDHAAKTDDRMIVERNFCDAFRTAAQRRLDGQIDPRNRFPSP